MDELTVPLSQLCCYFPSHTTFWKCFIVYVLLVSREKYGQCQPGDLDRTEMGHKSSKYSTLRERLKSSRQNSQAKHGKISDSPSFSTGVASVPTHCCMSKLSKISFTISISYRVELWQRHTDSWWVQGRIQEQWPLRFEESSSLPVKVGWKLS